MSEENDKNNRVGRDAFEREIATDLDEDTPDKPKGKPLHTKILVGLIIGVVAGIAVNRFAGGDHPRVVWVVDNITQPVGQLFLRSLLMIVVVLVFSSLVVGVAGIGDIRKLGRVGLKSFAYCLVISAISVAIGITLANTIQPGKRIDPATSAALQQRYATDATKTVAAATQTGSTSKPLMQVVETIVPKNPFYAIAGKEDPNMLHIMFFALVIGIAITLLPVPVTAPFLRVLEGLYEITAKIIEMIMKFAPYAVACLLFNNTARFGLDLLQALGVVCVDCAARLVAAHVWRLLALRLFPFAPLSDRVFPASKDGDSHSVLDVVFKCDFADGASSLRTESRCAASDQ